MILPIVLGIVTGKFVRKREIMFIVGFLIGLGLGLLGGLEIAPLMYPFMVTEISWVGVPEIRRVGLSFTFPDIVLFQESIYFQSYSLIMLSFLIAIGILGVILGILLGIKYRASDASSPWEQTDQPQ